jgi:hypothetical protein
MMRFLVQVRDGIYRVQGLNNQHGYMVRGGSILALLVRVSNNGMYTIIFCVDSSCAANQVENNSVSTVNYGVINLS